MTRVLVTFVVGLLAVAAGLAVGPDGVALTEATPGCVKVEIGTGADLVDTDHPERLDLEVATNARTLYRDFLHYRNTCTEPVEITLVTDEFRADGAPVHVELGFAGDHARPIELGAMAADEAPNWATGRTVIEPGETVAVTMTVVAGGPGTHHLRWHHELTPAPTT